MAKNLGGRPTSLKDGKPYCIVLDREQRDIVIEQKGDGSISEYIRECIMLRTHSVEGVEQEELRQLKEELLIQAKQLKQYKQAEHKRQKVNEEQLAYIGKRYKEWKETSGLVNNQSRFNWAQGCVKGLPISPEDALSYLQGEGFFILE